MSEVVISATRYPGNLIRAVVQAEDGSTSERDWFAIDATGLPPVELPAGVLMKAFVDGGGLLATASAADYVVPGFKSAPGSLPSPVDGPAPAPLDMITEEISDRQFAQGIWGDGLITFAECEAFVSSGTPPTALQAIVDQLPDDDTGAPTPRKQAVILIRGARTFQRHNPLTEIIREAWFASDARWTPDYLDARWSAWAKL